ncbi:hypothetical protein [Metabacillus litoralis]|uniref:hypothetical protein n=1 Tax=Metabacillus litoralis TaxID=152268 RepID=UPI00203A9247|nr:hypothetical protein [Metabacillus litoralis]MCM3160966.1 hypothetical protein [Metabacillus litoralis]
MTDKRIKQKKEDYKIMVSESEDDNERFIKTMKSEKFKDLIKRIITKYEKE